MKVYVYPADKWACGNYRMAYPAEELKRQGHDITVVYPGEKMMVGGRRNPRNREELESVFYPPDADVLVLQRTTHKWLAKAIPLLRARGVAVVVDIDDDLNHIDRNNPAWQGMHPSRHPEMNWHWLSEACRQATLVTVSTPPLVSVYAKHGRCAILRNCIPERFLTIDHEDSAVVGWAGALHSHPQDLALTSLATQSHAREGGDILVVGPEESGLQRALALPTLPATTGLVAFEDWGDEVTKLGIGLAPLVDTRFNRAKSWLKPLEYGALGVPCVVSQVPEYLGYHWLHEEGTTLMARRPRDWDREVRKLVQDEGLRKEMSGRGREVASQFTIEGNAHWWWEAWEAAYAGRNDVD